MLVLLPTKLTIAQDNGTFTYWGGLIFSDAANQLLVDRINQWGQEKGITVDVVMINQNETVQRVSAAIEAGTMPDALDMGSGFMLLLALQGQLEKVADTVAGGWRRTWRLERTDPECYRLSRTDG